MILNEPGKTNFDLNFRLFGVPIRIHPMFFVLGAVLGFGTGDGYGMLMFIAVLFISILVHEFGHVIAMMNYRQPARIVLHMMGGLAIPDDGGSWNVRSKSFNPNQQMVVSFAGPLAGFLLALLIIGVTNATGATSSVRFSGIIPIVDFEYSNSAINNSFAQYTIYIAVMINIYVNLLNLVPIFPLDGGQIARQLFIKFDPWNGIRNSLILSLVVAIALVLIGLSNGARFVAIIFAFMAFSNYQSLQMMGNGGFPGGKFGGGGRPW